MFALHRTPRVVLFTRIQLWRVSWRMLRRMLRLVVDSSQLRFRFMGLQLQELLVLSDYVRLIGSLLRLNQAMDVLCSRTWMFVSCLRMPLASRVRRGWQCGRHSLAWRNPPCASSCATVVHCLRACTAHRCCVLHACGPSTALLCACFCCLVHSTRCSTQPGLVPSLPLCDIVGRQCRLQMHMCFVAAFLCVMRRQHGFVLTL